MGASVRIVDGAELRTELRVEHGPAYEVARTLQSAVADVRHDRLTLTHVAPLGERWRLSVSAEAASLDHRGVSDSDRNVRLGVAASLTRSVTSSVRLGLAGRALRYMDAAPEEAALPLYWDPEVSVSLGPSLEWSHPMGDSWSVTAGVTPGLSYIDERGAGGELVPDLSGRLGVEIEGARFRTDIELFYGQGRFSGYRSYGVGVSFSAGGGSGPGGGP